MLSIFLIFLILIAGIVLMILTSRPIQIKTAPPVQTAQSQSHTPLPQEPPEEPQETEQNLPEEKPEDDVLPDELQDDGEESYEIQFLRLEDKDEETQKTIKETVSGYQNLNDSLRAIGVIWFQVDVGDGKEHIYYNSRNMLFRYWTKSQFNTEHWKCIGDDVVSGNEEYYLIGVKAYDSTQANALYKAGSYQEKLKKNRLPEEKHGEEMAEWIEAFQPGDIKQTETKLYVNMPIEDDMPGVRQMVFSFNPAGVYEGYVDMYYATDERIRNVADMLNMGSKYAEMYEGISVGSNACTAYPTTEALKIFEGMNIEEVQNYFQEG